MALDNAEERVASHFKDLNIQRLWSRRPDCKERENVQREMDKWLEKIQEAQTLAAIAFLRCAQRSQTGRGGMEEKDGPLACSEGRGSDIARYQ